LQITNSNLIEVNSYLKIYSNSYSNLLLYASDKESRIFLNWEGFIANPEIHIANLSKILKTKLNLEMLNNFGLNSHSFGGNVSVNENLKEENSAIKTAHSTKLPDSLLLEARSHEYAHIVYQRMMKLYNASFDIK